MLAKSGLQRFLTLLGCLLAGTSTAGPAPDLVVGHSVRTMGTEAQITVVGPDSTHCLEHATAAAAALQHVDELMSNWTTTSEVARINRGLSLGPTPLSPEARDVVTAALRIGAASGGAFDITLEPLVRLWGFLGGPPRVPSQAEIDRALARVGQTHLIVDPHGIATTRPGLQIDLGGIAKGHAVDQARAVLLHRGVSAALIDLSGNMVGLGSPPGRDSWVVGIRDPQDRVPYFARLALHDDAVATSADYEQFIAQDGRRYGHILDPGTGWPAQGLDAVTVLAARARDADAWATALFVSGPEAARDLARARDDVHAILIQPAEDQRTVVWVESSVLDRFQLQAGVEDRFEVRGF